MKKLWLIIIVLVILQITVMGSPVDKIFNNHYTFLGEIASGAFGKVYKARDTRTTRVVAIKVSRGAKESMVLKWESRAFDLLGQSASYHHIVRISKHFPFEINGDSHYAIVMEHLNEDVLNLFNNRLSLPLDKPRRYRVVRKIAKQMLKALQFIHERKVIHGDVKPENILLDQNNGIFKLSDFSNSIIDGKTADFSHLATPGVPMGTESYMAPEIYCTGTHTVESDMWALGVTLMNLYLMNDVFQSLELKSRPAKWVKLLGALPPELTRCLSENNFDVLSSNFDKQGSIEQVLGDVPEFLDFIRKLLHYDPNQRMNPDFGLNHAFIMNE